MGNPPPPRLSKGLPSPHSPPPTSPAIPRRRQQESFACDDLEPMQIHQLRSIPMTLFFPRLSESVMRGYAASQRPDGFLAHVLGGGCFGPPPAPSSTHGVFGPLSVELLAVDLWQMVRATNNSALLRDLWPVAQRVLRYRVERARRLGLPEHLSSAYDWFGFTGRSTTTYTTFMYLASLAAGAEMAGRVRDEEFRAYLLQAQAGVRGCGAGGGGARDGAGCGGGGGVPRRPLLRAGARLRGPNTTLMRIVGMWEMDRYGRAMPSSLRSNLPRPLGLLFTTRHHLPPPPPSPAMDPPPLFKDWAKFPPGLPPIKNFLWRLRRRPEERVTVQGPVKKQQPDGMSHRPGWTPPPLKGALPAPPACHTYHTPTPTQRPWVCRHSGFFGRRE